MPQCKAGELLNVFLREKTMWENEAQSNSVSWLRGKPFESWITFDEKKKVLKRKVKTGSNLFGAKGQGEVIDCFQSW